MPGGRVDNNGAGVDGSSINGLPDDVVGRNPRVEPVSADEINGQAFMGLKVQGDAVSLSTVAVANVEPVVSTMGFAGLDEGNGDAGQHGQPGSPGMNIDVVPLCPRSKVTLIDVGKRLLRARWSTTTPGQTLSIWSG